VSEPRMYCKTCNEFKQMQYGGGRIPTGWICKSCFKKMLNKKGGSNGRSRSRD